MGRKILLGISGSIAAYKGCEVLRSLVKEKFEVTVVMSENATKFVSPLTFKSLSGRRVYQELFPEGALFCEEPEHIEIARSSDLFMIAPATANIIGKIANGIADDLITTVTLAVRCPVLIAPAMNDAMYANPAVKQNIKLLKQRGIFIVEPGKGELACGEIGEGRLADVKSIIKDAMRLLSGPRGGELAGKTIVVSAGPTREPVDEIRFISNPSTGKMGYELARAAFERGAEVILVTGPTHLAPPEGVKLINIETALEMRGAILGAAGKADAVLMAAAVANYRPDGKFLGKIAKGRKGLELKLYQNPDILAELGKNKGGKILVGFSIEVKDHIKKAKRKLLEKNLDLIVSNDASREDSAFGTDTNVVQIIDRRGSAERFPKLLKREIADIIVDRVIKLFEREK